MIQELFWMLGNGGENTRIKEQNLPGRCPCPQGAYKLVGQRDVYQKSTDKWKLSTKTRAKKERHEVWRGAVIKGEIQ